MVAYIVQFLENFLVKTKRTDLSNGNTSLLDKLTLHWGDWEAPSIIYIFQVWLSACALGHFILPVVIFLLIEPQFLLMHRGIKVLCQCTATAYLRAA